MATKQIAPPINGYPQTYPPPKTDVPTESKATISSEQLEIQQEHHDWLSKAKKRQVKNRRMLALISRMESMLLDREAKMASLVARIESHESECMKPKKEPKLEAIEQQVRSKPAYGRYHIEHAAVREIFHHLEEDEERFKARLENIIEDLLQSL